MFFNKDRRALEARQVSQLTVVYYKLKQMLLKPMLQKLSNNTKY